MGALFSVLFSKIASLLKWFGDLYVAVFVAIWDLLKDIFCWAFDEILQIVVDAVAAIDVSGISGNLGAFGSIPGTMMSVLSAIGVGTALTIISTALIIRFGLQLIPFVRLGS